jgi:hypothetical protein
MEHNILLMPIKELRHAINYVEQKSTSTSSYLVTANKVSKDIPVTGHGGP